MRRLRAFFEEAARQGTAVQELLDRVEALVGRTEPTDEDWRRPLEESLRRAAKAGERATAALFEATVSLPRGALHQMTRALDRMAHCIGGACQAVPSGGGEELRRPVSELTNVLSGALQSVLQAAAALGEHGVESEHVSEHCREARPLVHCAMTVGRDTAEKLLLGPSVDCRDAVAWRFVIERLTAATRICGEMADHLELLRSELSVRRASSQAIF